MNHTSFGQLLLFLVLLFSIPQNTLAAYPSTSTNPWQTKSYPGHLNLLPYYDLQNLKVFTAPSPDCSQGQRVPFAEDFSTTSLSFACWDILDTNADSSSPTSSNIWKTSTTGYGPGASMYFYGGPLNDDYLISPKFELDSTKTYKLTYWYKTSLTNNDRFEVLASTTGKALSDFTTTVVANQSYAAANWTQQVVFLTNPSPSTYFTWHVTSKAYSTLYIDQVELQEVPCVEPVDLNHTMITDQSITMTWSDTVNSNWSYYLSPIGPGVPTQTGTPTTSTQVQITQDAHNTPLLPNTTYWFYVLAHCSSGASTQWVGPYSIKTLCTTQSIPFTESYDTLSSSLECWRFVDVNQDKNPQNNYNAWGFTTGAYMGNQAAHFISNSANTTHDDYLITPSFSLNGGIYALTYYYKTTPTNTGEFEIVLSQNGIQPDAFTHVIQPKAQYKEAQYTSKTVYISGITADVHIAWHMVGTGASQLSVDQVTLEQVDCIAPDGPIELTSLLKDQAEISWQDSQDGLYEYFVQPMGASASPASSGTRTQSKTAVLTHTHDALQSPLSPNTSYEVFVKAICGVNKSSKWIGPMRFPTPCDTMVLPFFEGFNTDSPTRACWGILDLNQDATSSTTNTFYQSPIAYFEGNQSMYFNGNMTATAHDDWLISPSFTLSNTRFYRLEYYYRTNTVSKTDFQVKVSQSGTTPAAFTQTLLHKVNQSDNTWVKQVHIISNISGTINIAWHVNSAKTSSHLYIDAVSLSEITTCPEPLNLGAKEHKTTEVTLDWEDPYGSAWQYVVQKPGLGIPTSPGTPSNAREVQVSQLQNSEPLEPNSEYEFYVRTDCKDTQFSIWSGPYTFRTACLDFSLPFWEGFNTNSRSINCWSIVDQNQDATHAAGPNHWKTATTNFEGTHMMFFHGNASDSKELPHDDWLISPRFDFQPGEVYRLKYHYKTLASSQGEHTFEVLASQSGMAPKDFITTIVPKTSYPPSDQWQQEYVYITGLQGPAYLAWHVGSTTAASFIYLDNIFVEQVVNCPEPMGLDALDITHNQAQITWQDAFKATEWEYVVQTKDKG